MERHRQSLDDYGVPDTDMNRYLYEYGRHFNRKLYEFAVSLMFRKRNGEKVKMSPLTRETFEQRMARTGVKTENDILYDGMYVMTMCEADYYGSSITDEKHLCLFVKDTVDDVDQPDGFIFNRFLSCVRLAGIPIDWEEML